MRKIRESQEKTFNKIIHSQCKRALDYQLCAEGPDSEIYCKLCYSYKHGHKAKPNLNTADVAAIQGDEGDPDVCPRYKRRSEK